MVLHIQLILQFTCKQQNLRKHKNIKMCHHVVERNSKLYVNKLYYNHKLSILIWVWSIHLTGKEVYRIIYHQKLHILLLSFEIHLYVPY